MHRHAGWLLVALVGLLAACGGLPSVSGSPSGLARLHAALAARAAAAHTLTVRVAAMRDSQQRTSYASAVVKVSGRRVSESLTNAAGRTSTTVDDGTNVWTYQSGSSQYGVESSLPTTGYGLRWVTFDWAGFLRSVRFEHQKAVSGATVISFRGQLAGQAASGSLTVSKALNPVALKLHEGATTMVLKVDAFTTTVPIPGSTFRFLPPSGATAVNTTPTVLSALTTATAALSYSVVVPTVHAGLVLERVDVVRSATYGQELLMQYDASSGAPVLATEWKAGPAGPYAKGSATDVVVDGRTVAERDVPGGGVYASVTVSGTTVVVEGPSGTVGATLANLTVASG